MEKTSPARVHWDVLPCGVHKELALHHLVFDAHGQAACVWPAIAQGHLGDCEHWGGLMGSKGEERTQLRSLATARSWCLSDAGSSAPCGDGWSS